MRIKLQTNQKLLAENSTDLPDGNRVVTEVVRHGDAGILVGTFFYSQGASEPAMSRWCGYCDGVLVGCVNCPNNDPYVNCVNNTVGCQS